MEKFSGDPASAPPDPTSAPSRPVFARFAVFVAALAVETAALRVNFDVRTLEFAAGWWSGLIGGSSATARGVLAFLAALVVLCGRRRADLVHTFDRHARTHRQWWVWFLLHLLGFAATFAFAGYIAAHESAIESLSRWRHAVPLVAAVTLAFWIACWISLEDWFDLIVRERSAVLAASAVAAAAWALGDWTQQAWKPLNEWTFRAVAGILRMLVPVVMLRPDERIVGTPQFTVSVGTECSGYEGIGLICVFLAAFFWSFRQQLRFPAVWLLLPIGIVTIWLCNSLRIAALVMIGTSISPGVAIRGFHSQAGWLFFLFVALSLMAVALNVPAFARRTAPSAKSVRRSAVDAYLVPLLALIALNMLIAALSDGFERLYPLKVVVAGGVLWRYRGVYKGFGWSWSWMAAANGLLVFILWNALAAGSEREGSGIPLRLDQLSAIERSLWLIFRTAGSALLVPLVEELAFRGYLQRRLVAIDFDEVPYQQTPLWAGIVASLLFGLMHGRWLAGALAGMCYTFAARRRGRLCDAVVAHAVTNALIAAQVLFADAWWLW